MKTANAGAGGATPLPLRCYPLPETPRPNCSDCSTCGSTSGYARSRVNSLQAMVSDGRREQCREDASGRRSGLAVRQKTAHNHFGFDHTDGKQHYDALAGQALR
jgi:hypothetical protein